ncbi:MAG: hypothetical protein DRI44_09105 [Chlamydiae bacterium]|nr:MAG: hypothetical protein DRI44_09105 [Chlamydiota bacterium]
MTAFFESLNGIEKIFLICAVIGSTLFLIRTVLFFIGGDADSDVDGDFDGEVDVDIDGDIDVDASDIGHIDSMASFHIFSLHGITGFFMMFGLVGLAMSRQSNLTPAIAVGGGLIAGVFTMWLVAKIFMGMKKLQSDGTLNIKNAIGADGTVYLNIPADGTGKVQVVVQESLKIFNAVSANKEKIKTGENVKVINVISGNVLVVRKVL